MSADQLGQFWHESNIDGDANASEVSKPPMHLVDADNLSESQKIMRKIREPKVGAGIVVLSYKNLEANGGIPTRTKIDGDQIFHLDR